MAFTIALPARAQVTAKSEHADGTLIFERSTVTPDDVFLGALQLKLADGWHVYWKNAGDSGLPPEATWTSSPQVTAGDFQFPTPHPIPLQTLMNYGYEHEVVLPFEVKISPEARAGDRLTISAQFDYLICADICVPEALALSVDLPVGGTPVADQAGSAIIAQTLPTIPVALTGRATVERSGDTFRIGVVDPSLAAAATSAKWIRFFPHGPDILHPAPQKVRVGPDGVSVEVTASAFAKPGSAALSGIIGMEQSDGAMRGWEVPAAPGVIPAGVSDAAFQPVGVADAGVALPIDALLVTLALAFLGGLVLNLMPCVLPVLTIKAAGLVHTAHDPKESRAHGIAYLAGVVICFAAIGGILVALKAAGDTSAGMGFQLQYAWVTAVFALVMFAVGLNLLGVFEIGSSLMGVGGNLADRGGVSGAFFTGFLAAFVGAPCVGPFMAGAVGAALNQPDPLVVMGIFVMIGAGLAAPFVLLSFTPAFAKLLPKPGKWMETFRQVLAFPMFATAAWLLWVLSGQSGADGVIVVLVAAIVLSFGIWLARKIGTNTTGRAVAATLILAGFAVPPVVTLWPEEQLLVEATAWSPDEVSELRTEGRVIFVDFTARWCVTCQVNKQTIHGADVQRTFSDSEVAFLEADWTNKDSVIFDELKRHGAGGVPLYLVYPAGGGEPRKFEGLLTAGQIQQAIREAAGSI
jgi:thiol:disulfide interchange protein DsbD